jgi:hypothetical protein
MCIYHWITNINPKLLMSTENINPTSTMRSPSRASVKRIWKHTFDS